MSANGLSALGPSSLENAFLRWGLRDVARGRAFEHWMGSPRGDEVALLTVVAEHRARRAGYQVDIERIAREEFNEALEWVQEHMDSAFTRAKTAATQALRAGASRRDTMQAAIDAVLGMDPLPPESVLVDAVERAFSDFRWQERAWKGRGA